MPSADLLTACSSILHDAHAF